MIKGLGNNLNNVLENYFEQFKSKMSSQSRILSQVVEDYEQEICFLVDTEHTLIKVVEPRTKWLDYMGYEIDIDFSSKSIQDLLATPKDVKAERFGAYEEAKIGIKRGLFIGKITKKYRKMMKTLVEKFGDDSGSSDSILVEAVIEGQLMLIEKPHDSEETELDKDVYSTPVSPSPTLKKKKLDV